MVLDWVGLTDGRESGALVRYADNVSGYTCVGACVTPCHRGDSVGGVCRPRDHHAVKQPRDCRNWVANGSTAETGHAPDWNADVFQRLDYLGQI